MDFNSKLTRFEDFTIVLNQDGTQTEKFIKESRLTRKEKIDRNQQYHRKNPKSVAYYQSLENQTSNQLLTDTIMNDLITDEVKLNNNNITKVIMSKNTDTTQDNMNSATSVANNQNDATKRSRRNKRKTTSSLAKPSTMGADTEMSARQKANIQLMFQNLAKHYKRDGIFLDNKKGYENIAVLKDFNIHAQVGQTRTALTLRAVIGHYNDLKQMILTHGTQFSPLKKHFQAWLTQAVNQSNPKAQLDEKLSHVFGFYEKDEKIKKFLPKLEEKLIAALRKPTKQNSGFLNKIEQIDLHWAEEAMEVLHIETIENQLRFSSYEESFPLARTIERKFSIFVGPTNSGKTYHALNELAKARHGAYLGPLRLMAHEGREALFERGILANLLTGEERVELPGATHVSSTVEMCHMGKVVDVAVIDEIQMIADSQRGWAWSQALIGVPAKHVVLVGSEEALPFILPVIKSLGEEFEIKRFERKTPLTTHDSIWKFKDLKAGDCVVAFSRKSALEMKNAIEAAGKRCSVIYGNLSPEVRRSEAAKFKSGENPVLVATDAIGMGLNLPINRLFFSTLEKFDGVTTRFLTISEIKQIAGRAGRYGFAERGEVGLLFDDNAHSLALLNRAIFSGYDVAEDTRVPIAPNLKQIQTICNTLGKQDLYSALIFFKEKMIRDHKLYRTANLDAMIEISSIIKNKNLDLATGLNYACVPIDTGSEVHVKHFFKWINAHLQEKGNSAPDLPEVISYRKNDSYSLYEAENYVKLCMAYRWLHYKYPDNYPEIEIVTDNAKVTNDYIEHALHRHIVISKNPRWRR